MYRNCILSSTIIINLEMLLLVLSSQGIYPEVDLGRSIL